MFTVSSITCDTKITNKNNTPKGCRFCVCRSDVFASKLKFIEFVYKYNTPIPDSNPKLNVVWQNKDGGSPKVPHSKGFTHVTSRHDSSRGVGNWIPVQVQGRFPVDKKFPKFRVEERMEQTFSGISIRKFGCTSRGWPKIPESRDKRKIPFHSTITARA